MIACEQGKMIKGTCKVECAECPKKHPVYKPHDGRQNKRTSTIQRTKDRAMLRQNTKGWKST